MSVRARSALPERSPAASGDVEVEGDRVVLEIAEGVRVRFVTAAIAKVVEPPGAVGTSDPTQASITEDDTTAG